MYLCRDRKELNFFIELFGKESKDKTLQGDVAPEEFSVHEYAGEPATYVDVYTRRGQIQAFKCYHYTQALIPEEDLVRQTIHLQLSDLHIGENKRPMRTPSNFQNVTCNNRKDFVWLAQRLAEGLNLKGAWGFHTGFSSRTGLNVVMDLNARIDAVQAGRFNEELGRWLREMLDRYPIEPAEPSRPAFSKKQASGPNKSVPKY